MLAQYATWTDAEVARVRKLCESNRIGMHALLAQAGFDVLMPDLRAQLGHCRFYNCTHRHEPGCGVREAVDRGEISPTRYRLYEALWDELEAGQRPG